MIDEKEEGLSIGEFIHVILIKKWLLLAVSVIVMIIGIIFIYGVYNPNKTVYQCEYELRFPGLNSGKFPDGKEIIYNDFISIENLEQAKALKNEYESIDVFNLINKNGVQIEQIVTINDKTYEVLSTKYRMSFKKKYFKSDEQARNFIVDLVNIPIQYALEVNKDINYKENLVRALEADDYISQINYMIAQRDMILTDYIDLISEYSNGFKYGDKTLSMAQLEISSFFSKNDLDALKKEVSNNGYIKNDNYKYSIQQEKINLQKEYEANDLKISSLKNEVKEFIEKYQDSSSIQLDQALAVYQKEIADLATINSGILSKINNECNVYLGYEPQTVSFDEKGTIIWSPLVPISSDQKKDESKFKEKLTDIMNHLELFSDTYTNFVHSINETYSYVVYHNGSRITKDGGMSLILAVIIFLVIGFVLACCINLAIDMPKYIKNKKKGALNLESEEKTEEKTIIEEQKE